MGFNKSKLLLDLHAARGRIGSEHNFTLQDGWSQVEGKGEDVNRAYGEWDRLNIIIDGIVGGYLGT